MCSNELRSVSSSTTDWACPESADAGDRRESSVSSRAWRFTKRVSDGSRARKAAARSRIEPPTSCTRRRRSAASKSAPGFGMLGSSVRTSAS